MARAPALRVGMLARLSALLRLVRKLTHLGRGHSHCNGGVVPVVVQLRQGAPPARFRVRSEEAIWIGYLTCTNEEPGGKSAGRTSCTIPRSLAASGSRLIPR